MRTCPRLHIPLHSGIEHGGYVILGISPPGLREVIDCLGDRMTTYLDLDFAGGGKWLRQTFGSPRQQQQFSQPAKRM